jgi:hypothetical protein
MVVQRPQHFEKRLLAFTRADSTPAEYDLSVSGETLRERTAVSELRSHTFTHVR